jgi:hypothetical protein
MVGLVAQRFALVAVAGLVLMGFVGESQAQAEAAIKMRAAEAAMETLRRSADKGEREKAFDALQAPPRLPVEWAEELGKIVQAGGWEADRAVKPLAAAVEPEAYAVLLQLLREPSFDTRMRAARVLALRNPLHGVTRADGLPIMDALQPFLQDPNPETRFTAVLALGGIATLPVENRLKLINQLLQDPSEVVRRGAVVIVEPIFFSQKYIQDELVREMEVWRREMVSIPPRIEGDFEAEKRMSNSPSEIIRFVGVWQGEKERRRNDVRYGMMHVQHPPPSEADLQRDGTRDDERQRRRAVDKSLTAAGRAALEECLRLKEQARTPVEQLCLVRCLAYVYPSVRSEYTTIVEAMRALPVERGSVLEREIQDWITRHPAPRPDDDSLKIWFGPEEYRRQAFGLTN